MAKKSTAPEILGFNVDLAGHQAIAETASIDWSKGLHGLIASEHEIRTVKEALDRMDADAKKAIAIFDIPKNIRESIAKTEKQYQSFLSFATPSESALKFFEQEKKNYETLFERINSHEDIFSKLQDSMNSPESKGLSALLGVLTNAQQNADIRKSKAATEVLEMFHALVSMARLNASSDEIMNPLIEQAEKSARSSLTGQNARKKNATLREWVRKQWPKYKEKGYSKARFARWCIANPPQGIPGRLPSVEQIVREWLKEK